jgi:hypothetical protein
MCISDCLTPRGTNSSKHRHPLPSSSCTAASFTPPPTRAATNRAKIVFASTASYLHDSDLGACLPLSLSLSLSCSPDRQARAVTARIRWLHPTQMTLQITRPQAADAKSCSWLNPPSRQAGSQEPWKQQDTRSSSRRGDGKGKGGHGQPPSNV